MGLFALGTKGSWDIWLLGQKVVGTFGFWDKMYMGHLVFGTNLWIFGYFWDIWHWDKMSLGQFTYGLEVFGTIHLLSKSHWDNSLGDTVSCIKTGKIALQVKNGMGI